jgi:hypothetical protein
MEKRQKVSNFWFGFSLGILFTAFFTFLFGTKKGRKILKNFLEYSENYEENFRHFLEKIKFLVKEEFLEKEGFNDNKKNNHQEKKVNLGFSEIIGRIKYLAHPVKKQTKKFFVKEGRIVEKTS